MTAGPRGEGWLAGIAFRQDTFTIFLRFGVKRAEPSAFFKKLRDREPWMQVLEDEGTLPVFFMNDQPAVTPNANYCGFQLTRDCACSKILNKWISFYLKLFIGTNWE